MKDCHSTSSNWSIIERGTEFAVSKSWRQNDLAKRQLLREDRSCQSSADCYLKGGCLTKVRLFPRKFAIDVTLKALLDDPADEFPRENPSSFSTADLKLGNCRIFSKRTEVQNRMKTFCMSILRHRWNGNEFKTVQVSAAEIKACLRKHFESFNIY